MTVLAEHVHNPLIPSGYDIAAFGVTAAVLVVIVTALVLVIRRIVRRD